MAHHCKYLIAHCIDFRLQKAINDYLEKGGLLGDCDVVSVAGGVKNTDFLLEQIDISVNLHKVQEVLLLNHTDCGAYGGKEAFGSAEEEYEFHAGELKKAREGVLAKYPYLKARMMLAVVDESNNVSSFEEINV